MSFKKFFQPNIVKIILAIVLLFIPVYRQVICPISSGCFSVWSSAFSLFLEGLNTGRLDMSIPILIVSVAVSYLISCALILLYNKIGNKK